MLLFQSASQSKREGSSVRRPVPHHPTLRQRELVCTRGSVPKKCASFTTRVCARCVESTDSTRANIASPLQNKTNVWASIRWTRTTTEGCCAGLGTSHACPWTERPAGCSRAGSTTTDSLVCTWCTPDDFRLHPQQGSGCKWPSNPILGPKRMARSCARPRKLESLDSPTITAHNSRI